MNCQVAITTEEVQRVCREIASRLDCTDRSGSAG